MQPSLKEKAKIEVRYQRAEAFLQAAHGSKKMALNTTVVPHWIDHSEFFWYCQRVPSD